MKPSILACAALALLAATPAGAQSYDCRGSKTAAELVICDRSDLGRLDHKLNHLYGRALASSSRIQARQIREDQRDWLAERRECGPNPNCIRRHYQRRLSVLRGIIAD